MPTKNMHYSKEQQEKIDRLHKLLEAQGVNTKDPKRGGFSDSALFRWLVERGLMRAEDQQGVGRLVHPDGAAAWVLLYQQLTAGDTVTLSGKCYLVVSVASEPEDYRDESGYWAKVVPCEYGFEEGDNVRLCHNSDFTRYQQWRECNEIRDKGLIGVIALRDRDTTSGYQLDYLVEFDGYDRWWFSANELCKTEPRP